YDNKHFVDDFTRTLSTPIKLSNSVTVKPVEFEEEADVSLAYATVGLFMRWQPRLERWYVFAGPAAGFNISSSINHTQRIVTEELTFREILDTERTSKDASFPATDYRLEAMVGFGYDYIVRPRWYVNPEIRIGYPISTVSDDAEVTTIPPGYDSWDDWKVASFQISIGLKYEAF
ncbi:MAG: hypothetical protein CL946_13025, partial [Ectothiorhodospiraceae bacterium]|nr:hypothetical protein [Ectothiorhodospiraceae bacterium]